MPTPIPAPPLVDAAAGTPSLRTLGSGSLQAAAGNDTRLSTPANAQTTPAAGKIPLADANGVIAPAWIVDASDTTRGLVSTGSQTFAGDKIFNGYVLSKNALYVRHETLGVVNLGPSTATASNQALFLDTAMTDANALRLAVGIQGSATSPLSNGFTTGAFVWSGTWSATGPANALDLHVGAHRHDGSTGPDPTKMMTFKAASPYNVGIGIPNPGSRLAVAGTIESTSGGFKFPDATIQTTAGLTEAAADTRYVNVTGDTMSGNLRIDQAATTSYTHFYTRNSGGSKEAQWGLGPSTDGIPYGGHLTMWDGTTYRRIFTAASDATVFVIGDGSSPSLRVGIGRTPTTYKFEVDGDIRSETGSFSTPTGGFIGQYGLLHTHTLLQFRKTAASADARMGLSLGPPGGPVADDFIFSRYDSTNGWVEQARIPYAGGFKVDGDTFNVDAVNNRVGIGTATPATQLDVRSTGTPLRIQNTSSTGYSSINVFDSAGAQQFGLGYGNPTATGNWADKAYLQLNKDLIFTRNDGTIMARLDQTSGNFIVDTNTFVVDSVNNKVGVGIAAPAVTLDVRGLAAPPAMGDTTTVAYIINDNTAYNASPKAGIGFGGRSNLSNNLGGWGAITVAKANATSDDYGAYMSFHTRPLGSAADVTERMRISAEGNVTISTGKIIQAATNTTATPGNATANTPMGKSAVAAGVSTVTITNSLVTADSYVFLTPLTQDQAVSPWSVSIAAGSFTVTINANAPVGGWHFQWEVKN